MVTIDEARRTNLPVHLGKPFDFAYRPSIRLGGLVASDLIPLVDRRQWQFQILGIPIYTMSGWMWGAPLLVSSPRYLIFNNPAKQVTFGFETFYPDEKLDWRQYDMTYDQFGRPYLHLPVAGVDLYMLIDSGGGKGLQIEPKEWDQIASKVQVVKHRREDSPEWEGWEKGETYIVRSLNVGGLELEQSEIWVRQKTPGSDGFPPLFGLGLYRHETLVLDFQRHKLWIGSRRTFKH